MSARAPINFSWIEEGKLAAFGWPSSSESLRFLLGKGIINLITLSPEKKPPIHAFAEFNWTEIKIREFYPPTLSQVEEFIMICEKAFERNEIVGIHCRMGRGRTGTMAACYLVKFHDMSPQAAMGQIQNQRPGSIETYSQEESVMDYYYHLCKQRQK